MPPTPTAPIRTAGHRHTGPAGPTEPSGRIRTRLRRTGHAVGHAGDPSTWRTAFRLRPKSPSLIPALRVGLATAAVLAIGGATGHRELAALAGLGAITAAFARGEPYPRRAGKTGAAGGSIIAAVLLGSAIAGLPATAQIAVLSAAGGIGAWFLAGMRVTGPGAVVIVFAGAAAAMTDDLPRAGVATALGVAVGWVCAMLPVSPAPDSAAPDERRWIATGTRRLRSGEFVAAGVRIAAASAPAGWAALAMGLGHPLWATMGATAALQSVSYASTMQRGVQRVVGNVTGAVVALGLIAAGIGFWESAATIVVLQVITELTIARNYAVATTAITPMALLMMGLTSSLTASMAVSRVIDTALGVVIGIVVAAVSVHRDDDEHVAPGRARRLARGPRHP